jgi:hypothetical protein
MTPTITLQQREKQLQSLLGTPEGREELQELANRYFAASGKVRPARTSLIPTFWSRSGNRA